MEIPVASVTSCSVCGELLNAKGECLACLLRTASDEVVDPSVPRKLQETWAERAGAPRTNLPAQLSSFIGREREITEIKKLLADTRLLTLTGAGGCGKTRLALRVAADLLSEYPDGVWLVELAAASDPDMVAHLTVEALGIQEQQKRSLLETLVDRLRAKRLLLVWDNCEHLIDACAKLADALLKTCPNLRILATSRETIGVAGERVWQVPPLAIPDLAAPISPESLCEFEAVRLFRDRAVAVQPKFALTRATARAVAQICWRLDGMPLAIELAAARMSALSAAQIAERLQDNFQVLSRGMRTAIPRHETLKATIDWSYALLTDAERSLFQRLSVFMGGFDLKAAENICAGEGIDREQILDLLTELVKKSLVLTDEQAGTTRYRLLEPIRQYGQDRLRESGAMPTVHGQHVNYFLRVAQDAEPRMLGPEQRLALDEVEIERPNFLAALGWAAEHEPETALKLSNTLGWFWERRGSLAEGREWFKRTITQSPAAPVHMRGEAYVRSGRIACWQGEYEHAIALTEQGLRMCKEAGDRRWVGLALDNLGGIAAYRGELDHADTLLEESLSIGKDLGDKDLLWRSLLDLGVVAMFRGNYERARDLVEEAVRTVNEVGYAYGLEFHMLGEIESALGNIEKAIACYEETLAFGRRLGHKRAVVGGLEGLGKVAFDQGDYARARAFYEEGFQVADELGQKSEFAISLGINLAELAVEERKFDEARRHCTSSLHNSKQVGDKESIVAALSTFAWLCFASAGRAEVAAQFFGAAEGIRVSLGIALPSRERGRHEHHVAAIRDALGQEAFASAWTRGKAMSIDEAIAHAMETPVASGVATCSQCGEPLNSKSHCLACLLRTALDESLDKSTLPASLVFGDFEIVRREDGSLWELGRGAFGVTYLAEDNVLRRRVALKVIEVPAAARTLQSVRERFLREARAAAALRHPNVATVYQFGASPDDSQCYYAMELVEGETLETRVRREGPLDAKLTLEIAIQITRTLMAAAAHGLVHRDLKPGNIMLTRSDADTPELEVKVIDFGLAKALAGAGGEMDLTHGEFVGTPNFASPEQFESGPVDVRSDIYSLGATLWFALTGKTPFPGRNIEEIRSAQKSNALPVEQLKAAHVPPSLRSLLESMLALEPAARPGIQDLATQLRRCSMLVEIEMAAEGAKEIQFEIAHVLFIDIVGYSKLSINEQHAAVDELTRIVRSTEQFQKADAADRLIKIPSGDGMALVFYTNPEASLRCAAEISRALKDHPRLQIRMGIHSGPVRGVIDVAGRANLAGAGLNLAQRIMECGDAGHILLSKHVAEDLSEFEEWRPLLHDLGTCEVKHGAQVAIVNLWSDDVGNRQLPQTFRALRKKRTRERWAEMLGALVLLAGIVAAFVLVSRRAPPLVAIAPEKSIAVLPFENLSEDKANAFFADGVQDEILTDLARIADLKVISRTSVMHYKSGVARNLREIGHQLGVANVVEGSVQRSGNRVRVNAQLIDAGTDRHLWGQTYDRDLADVFAIQSEIAKTIADQLQAKLSPAEKSAIDLAPTNDLVAFDLYTRAKDLSLASRLLVSADKADYLHVIELLNQAVARDPSFFDAYCQLATAHGLLYLLGLDRTPARLASAEAAVEAAARLRPDAGETHLARAQILYQGHLDYNGALAELELARQTLPNDSRIYQLIGFIQRRQKGRYEEATRTLEHAIDLDPRNVLTLSQIAAFNYRRLGRHADAKAVWDRSLAIRPDDTNAKVNRAMVHFDWKADTRPLHQTIDSIRTTDPAELQSIASDWLVCALAERDAAAAKNALAAAGDKLIILSNENVFFHRPFVEAVVARMTQDDAAARSAFTAARTEQEKIVQAQPSYGPALCVLGLIDAGLGRKEEAIREGRRAIELLPVEKDLPEGMDMIKYLAMIAAWVGDKDLACQQLAVAIHGPSGLTYGELKLLPLWDPLRGDPRFEKIVASLAPK